MGTIVEEILSNSVLRKQRTKQVPHSPAKKSGSVIYDAVKA